MISVLRLVADLLRMRIVAATFRRNLYRDGIVADATSLGVGPFQGADTPRDIRNGCCGSKSCLTVVGLA